jgi:hypothetical protein
VITGSNFSTECCREPEEWGGYLGIDTMLFHDIHRQFGNVRWKLSHLKIYWFTSCFIRRFWG